MKDQKKQNIQSVSYPRLRKMSRSIAVRQMVTRAGLGSHKVNGTVWDRGGNWPPGRRACSKISCSSAWPICAIGTTEVKTTDIWYIWRGVSNGKITGMSLFFIDVSGHL